MNSKWKAVKILKSESLLWQVMIAYSTSNAPCICLQSVTATVRMSTHMRASTSSTSLLTPNTNYEMTSIIMTTSRNSSNHIVAFYGSTSGTGEDAIPAPEGVLDSVRCFFCTGPSGIRSAAALRTGMQRCG